MKILFIGNSYTYFNDLPALLQHLAEENGHPIEVFSVTKGGRKLFQYLDLKDEYSEKLNALLAEHEFDAAILQEQSLLPMLDPNAFRDGAVRLNERLKGHAERVILYATWGRKEGSPDLATYNRTRKGMTDELAEAYAKVGEEIGAEVAHVGRAFYAVNEARPEIDLHNPDLTHPSRLGSCLAAMVHYKTVFLESPKVLASLGLDEETAAAFRAAL